jgi:hypothetical protein
VLLEQLVAVQQEALSKQHALGKKMHCLEGRMVPGLPSAQQL